MAQKMNDMAGIMAMSNKEVKEELEKTHIELMGLRLGLATRQLQKSADLQKLREKVARLRSRQSMLKREAAPEKTPKK